VTLSEVKRSQNGRKEDDETRSNCSTSSTTVQKPRKTVAQVKSENALKKANKVDFKGIYIDDGITTSF